MTIFRRANATGPLHNAALLLALLACVTEPAPGRPTPARTAASRTHAVDASGAAEFYSIMDAVDAASSGDTIEVAPGNYYGSIDFSGKTLAIVSTGGASVTTIYATPGDAAVTAKHGEGPGTVLEGFTISGGGSSVNPAIEQQFASLTLRNDLITGTTGYDVIYARSSFIVLDRVTIDGTNTSSEGYVLEARRGEAIVKDSEITCGAIGTGYRMEHGSAMVEGSTFHCDGATAVSIFHSQGRVQRVVLEGALDVENESNGSEPTVVEGAVLRGGVDAYYCWLQLYNVVVTGAPVALQYATLQATNSVFTRAECGIQQSSSSVSVSYSDFFHNTANACGFTDPVGVSGNLDLDPGFVDWEADWHLASGSGLVDVGSAQPAFADVDGSQADIGAYGGPFNLDGGW